MSQQAPDPARRRLLGRTRDTAGGAAALAVFGPTNATPEAPAAAAVQDEQQPRGYHETEHTRRYYELARF